MKNRLEWSKWYSTGNVKVMYMMGDIILKLIAANLINLFGVKAFPVDKSRPGITGAI